MQSHADYLPLNASTIILKNGRVMTLELSIQARKFIAKSPGAVICVDFA
jgi:hypothetical protein